MRSPAEASGADGAVTRTRVLAGFRTALALAAAALILSPALVLAVRDLGLEADAARAAARAAGGGVGEAGTAAEGKFKPFENIGGGGTAGEGDGKVPEVEEDEFGGAKSGVVGNSVAV
ncbi:hypothetical protein T484DRAFT_1828768 [Baffinella frigidus]|nr:hypothetical protein T484DRAFT_1828768 [Cryptophyta sp. CCMP2293]